MLACLHIQVIETFDLHCRFISCSKSEAFQKKKNIINGGNLRLVSLKTSCVYLFGQLSQMVRLQMIKSNSKSLKAFFQKNLKFRIFEGEQYFELFGMIIVEIHRETA